LFFLLLTTSCLEAQQFGGNPPSLHWRQINSDTARVIFPSGLEPQAQQVAAIVQRLSGTTLPTIGRHLSKINIVLQNQTTISNGYVGLAPFRSEFQLTPEQNSFDLGSLPWQKLLAIHEYRHVQQYNNFRTGLSGAFYYLFGEGGQALANSLSIPNWFWEGDAVYQETLVSGQGRGRQPYFFNGYRSLWAAGKDYSWMKLRNGSLRDYVPNHYPVGYMLVAYGRERYGDEFWRRVTKDAAAFRGLFYPMQRAIRKYSGVSFDRFREDALNYFKKVNGLDHRGAPGKEDFPADRGVNPDAFAKAHKHFVADEEFPQFIGRDSVLYMQSSYKHIPAFVIRDLRTGKERTLRVRAISLDNYFSCRNGKVVYAAYETDPRWGWRDYSVIRALDLLSGEDVNITTRTTRSKYFSPDISEDGRHIIAVREGPDGACALHLLNGRTGALEKEIPNKDSLFYTYPKFFGEGQVVSAVRNTNGEMALVLVNLNDGAMSFLTPATFQTIGYPSVSGDTVWFTASRDGQDRVFGFAGGRPIQVRLPYGNPAGGQYAFAAGQGKYAWTTFTSVGYRMNIADPGQIQFGLIPAGQWDRSLSTQGIDSLERGPAHLLDRIEQGTHPVEKYPAAFHLINFHTWRPYINDPDYMFSLASENILNTLQSELFVDYNRNEGYTEAGVNAIYGGWYPQIDAGANYIFNRKGYTRYGNRVYFNESQLYGGLSVPLNFTQHLSFTSLRFGSDVVYKQEYFQGAFKDSFHIPGFAYIDPYIRFTHQIQRAQQQIYPRLAQTLYLTYNKSLTDVNAHQFLASGYLYFPGLAFTHNLVAGVAFQQRDKASAGNFTNNFPFARGYSAVNFYRMYRFAGNYNLPLLYPDGGIGNIVYLMRVRANLFYDYMKATVFDRATGNPFDIPFRSLGTEIYFDTKWWNQLPISFGIRYSHLLDPDFEGRGPNQWELILPLNILSQGYSGRKASAFN